MGHTRSLDYSSAYSGARFQPYPEDEQGWRDLYDLRWRLYTLDAVDDLVRGEGLFAELDDDRNDIGHTKQLFRLFPFVADIDAQAIHGGALTLEVADQTGRRASSSPLLLAAEAIWRRSLMGERMPYLMRMLCALGDRYVEAVRMSPTRPYGVRLVDYDPRTVIPVYDRTGLTLESVTVTIDELDAARSGANASRSASGRYVRTVDKREVHVTVNGQTVDAESGPHGLGVVPVVHLSAIPWDAPEHSLPAPHGVERGVLYLDSLAAQTHAIGRRMANPIPYIQGAALQSGGTQGRLGRWLEIPFPPNESAVGYMEPQFAGLAQLRETAAWLLGHLERTLPEMLFSESAAAESGVARSLRGNAFEAKIRDMRASILGALARVTSMGVAMEAGRGYDADEPGIRIDAPPVLPRNVASELEQYELVKGELTKADRVRWLQRLGIVRSEHDPDEYAAEVEDQGAMGAVMPGARTTETDAEDDAGGEDEGNAEAADEIEAALDALRGDAPDIEAARESLTEALRGLRGRD